MNKRVLVVFAMKEEAQGLFEASGVPVLYTGLGKVNATYQLMREIARLTGKGERPEVVVNFGTAGSPRFVTHSLVEITRFVQRDMDVSALGFAPGTTPFDTMEATIESAKRFSHLPSGTCGTGDSFETGTPKVACDVVDMEAYAYAKVCRLEGIDFISLKYISDGSDHNAHNDWNENLPKAAACFLEAFNTLICSKLPGSRAD